MITTSPSAPVGAPLRRRLAATPPRVRVWCFVGLLAGAAAALHTAFLSGLAQAGAAPHVPWLLLVLGFAAAEITVAYVRVGSSSVSFSVSEVLLVLGLYVASPTEAVSAAVLGAGVVMLARRRLPLVKVAFNMAHTWFGAVVVVGLWRLVVDERAVHELEAAVAAVAAAVLLEVLSAASIAVAIALHTGGLRVTKPPAMRVGALAAVANASFGLVAVDVLRQDVRDAWAVLILAGFLVLAQRAHLALLVRHDSLESLQVFVARVGRRDMSVEAVARQVLVGVRDLLGAESAALVLAGGEHGSWVCDADGLRPGPPVEPGGVPSRTVLLRAEEGPVAELTVTGEALAPSSRRGRDSLLLLEALAGHAGMALQNARLTDRLRAQSLENQHQALHDALTSLPNRVLLDRTATAALADGRRCCMLLFDLDRFKEVNDTLGHAAGDAVLQEVGRRLRAALPGATCVARLGGDEFAVLLADADLAEGLRTAGRIREVLSTPLDVDGLSLLVDATVGVATSPDHGEDVDALLRHADVAMYAAKEHHTGCATYDPARDHHSTSRLSLVADLREGLAQGQLSLVYQPKTATADRRVLGVEALVRWDHPVRGRVAPDEFIGVAERTGLIGPLTDHVVEQALAQCRAWADEGVDLGVAINISPRTLHDDTFPGRLVDRLQRARVPAERVTLEITEGALMVDPERALAVLRQLRAHGLRLSVDDLGVGHSSLANLKHLPVDEIKIDRSFVTGLAEDPDDEAIVGALVTMVHRLGMTVVAEGVEDEATLEALARLGADAAQGYWMSRPLPAAEVPDWLRRWTAAGVLPTVPGPRRPTAAATRVERPGAAAGR